MKNKQKKQKAFVVLHRFVDDCVPLCRCVGIYDSYRNAFRYAQSYLIFAKKDDSNYYYDDEVCIMPINIDEELSEERFDNYYIKFQLKERNKKITSVPLPYSFERKMYVVFEEVDYENTWSDMYHYETPLGIFNSSEKANAYAKKYIKEDKDCWRTGSFADGAYPGGSKKDLKIVEMILNIPKKEYFKPIIESISDSDELTKIWRRYNDISYYGL